MQADEYTILCFSEMSLPRADLFPDFIVLTSSHEHSAYPIPSTFEVTLQATKPRTLVYGIGVFMMPQMTITITNIFTVLDKSITAKNIVLMIEFHIFSPKSINSFM